MLIPILGNIIAALNRIGKSTDTASSNGNLHQKVSDVKGSTGSIGDTASSTGTLHGKVLDLRNQVGATNDAASATGSVNAKLVDIKNALNSQGTSALATQASVNAIPTSPIRNVQRGTTSVAGQSGQVNVTISSVNTNKAFCNIQNSSPNTWLVLTGSTTLQVNCNTGNAGNVNVYWEVIEYV